MFGRFILALLASVPIACVLPASAQIAANSIDINAGPLSRSLQELQRQTGIELLFDPSLIAGSQAPAIAGDHTTEAALRALLRETNLTVRRAQSGAWVIASADATALEQPDAPVSEIIVVTGQRSINADIRRFETDIQPYNVVAGAELRAAHRDNIDQFFSSRVTSNATVVPAGLSQSADVRSAIDLRGLGTRHTLVLIDGRRLPGVPGGVEFDQSDINAIPMHAVERIEVLTGTASGIHGYGALGGVVNVVLDRDQDGFSLFFTQGVSDRDDARRQAIEASFGGTTPDGDTQFAIFAAQSESDELRAGQREFELRDRRRTLEVAPDIFDLFGATPNGDAVSVRSTFGANLRFKPEFGGATLPSSFTFLPTGFSGDAGELSALLAENAGQLDFSLSEADADVMLMPRARSEALLFNVRHQFGDGLEIYADALAMRSRGEFSDPSETGSALISPSSPVNPFTEYISLSFPVEGMSFASEQRIENTRYTIGLNADLPFEWRANAEVSQGEFSVALSNVVTTSLNSFLILLGDPSDLATNPFGDWDDFQAALTAYPLRLSSDYQASTEFRNYALRLAGPVFHTDAGPATLTLLAEHRQEDIPSYRTHQTTEYAGLFDEYDSYSDPSTSIFHSLYGELRAPLLTQDTSLFMLRDLEVQLAVRHDHLESEFIRYPVSDTSERLNVRFSGTSYTAGFRTSPARWLMLRGSYAIGEQPPPLSDLQELEPETRTDSFVFDPRRNDEPLLAPYVFKSGGNSSLAPLEANTTSFGMVLTPFGVDGPRLSADYSRIRRSGDVIAFFTEQLLANEALFPDRVIRAPLSDADRALGYEAGPITMIDTRSMNGGTLSVDTLDLRAEWPLSFLGGRLRLYAEATRYFDQTRAGLLQPTFQLAGYFDGPLEWRANAGLDWSIGDLTLGTNVQYYGAYSTLFPAGLGSGISTPQGADEIPGQTYVDLYASWRLPTREDDNWPDVTIDFGVVNVFDQMPERETQFSIFSSAPGYSRYGDPRQRRFELVLSARF